MRLNQAKLYKVKELQNQRMEEWSEISSPPGNIGHKNDVTSLKKHQNFILSSKTSYDQNITCLKR